MGSVNVEQALDLKVNHGLSYAKIGKIQNVAPNAVYSRIKHLLPDKTTEIWEENKAKFLSHAQLRVMSQLDARRLKKMSAHQAVVSTAILIEKQHLIEGKPTEIIDNSLIAKRMQEIKERLALLDAKTIDVTPKVGGSADQPESGVSDNVQNTGLHGSKR